MWKRRSALLAPLTALTSNSVPWTWNKKHKKVFDAIKNIILRKTLFFELNFNQPFDTHIDARDLQVSTVIIQNSKPIAFTAEN